MKLKLLKMKQAYPQMIMGDGIFADLSLLDVPWQTSLANMLDILYYQYSANKWVSLIVNDYIEAGNQTYLTTENRRTIANAIFTMYKNKWGRLYNLLVTSEYNPIENYNMVESESVEKDVTNAMSHTGTLTDVGNGTETQTGTISDEGMLNSEQSIYGFNSATDVGANADETTNTSTNTRNLTNQTNDSKTTTRNLNDNETVNDDTNRELTRSGNIGVTTTQQMMQQEIDIRNNTFYTIVFRDIDNFLCLSVY